MGKVEEISESIFRAIIYAPVTCFRFLTYCSISKLERYKCDWCQKLRPNYTLFDPPPVKIRGVMVDEMSERIFRATPRTQPLMRRDVHVRHGTVSRAVAKKVDAENMN